MTTPYWTKRFRHAVPGRRAGHPAAGQVGALRRNVAALLGVAGDRCRELGEPTFWLNVPDEKVARVVVFPNKGCC